jgi:hypothetical protein
MCHMSVVALFVATLSESDIPASISFILEEFAEQFTDLDLSTIERPPANRRCAIRAPRRSAVPARNRTQIAFRLECMENWIERARAEAVAMAFEFLHDAKTKNRLARRVMQNMQPDKARIQLPIAHNLRRVPQQCPAVLTADDSTYPLIHRPGEGKEDAGGPLVTVRVLSVYDTNRRRAFLASPSSIVIW